MDNKNYTNWVDFYSEFASKLLFYKDKRVELIELIQSIYNDISISFPRLEEDHSTNDIDPFTVFGMFNKGIKEENRIAILRGIASKFKINKDVPTSFDGIPVLNNLSSCFFGWEKDRKPNDIDNLWEMFEIALRYADKQEDDTKSKFIQQYNKVIKQKQVKWNLTMGLFWIRPYFYINLDDRNRKFVCIDPNLKETFLDVYPNLIKKIIPNGVQYLKLCEQGRYILSKGNYEYSNFPELSHYAWIYTLENPDSKTSSASFLKWFKPILEALKEVGGYGTPDKVKKQIIKDLKLSDAIVSETRGKNNVNKFGNEVAFARNYLVYEEYLDKSPYGVWTLTEKGYNVKMTDELASNIFTKWNKINSDKRKNPPSTLSDEDVGSVHYWVYSPGNNAEKWDEFYSEGIMGISWDEIGDLEEFASKEEIKQKMKVYYGDEYSHTISAHTTWQFANEMRVGDIIFAKKGLRGIIGRGIVESDYMFDESRNDYKHIRYVNWVNRGEWEAHVRQAKKSLTDITSYTEDVNKLNELFDIEEKDIIYPVYTEQDFLNEVYMSADEYAQLINVLKNKKNIILQGAPGVGKTYAAKRLAYSVMGTKDIERVMMVQFHQSYSYEDFIMGFRPSSNGFELKTGPFYSFCKKAEIDSDNDYFFIIDEINRGNLSKIFGELFMLIENDKRDIELQLLYSDEKFSVPDNVYIIGMMNTADRSLAMLDYAMRRRPAFFELVPAFESDGFKEYQDKLNNTNFNNLLSQIKQLNEILENDESLGAGFRIGHSYLCNIKDVSNEKLNNIIDYEVIPLLNEYWFDDKERVKEWKLRLKGAVR